MTRVELISFYVCVDGWMFLLSYLYVVLFLIYSAGRCSLFVPFFVFASNTMI